MRIVLDTNVLISGIFFSGPPFRILKAWKESRIQVVLSHEILSEYQRVAEALSVKYPEIEIAPIIDLIIIYGEFIDANATTACICDDPDDNKFIECALAGHCKIIVSGDKHLLKVSGYQGITVLKPRDFVDLYLE